MNQCAARKGFLTLSDCGEPATTACSNCGRPMCSAHLSAQSGFTMCLDCAASDQSVQEGEYDGVWRNRYRDTYYTSSGYIPMHRSTYYDDQDTRSFDGRPRDADEDDVDRAGFGDS